MNIADIVIITIIGLLLCRIGHHCYKKKKTGSGCGCHCLGCSAETECKR